MWLRSKRLAVRVGTVPYTITPASTTRCHATAASACPPPCSAHHIIAREKQPPSVLQYVAAAAAGSTRVPYHGMRCMHVTVCVGRVALLLDVGCCKVCLYLSLAPEYTNYAARTVRGRGLYHGHSTMYVHVCMYCTCIAIHTCTCTLYPVLVVPRGGRLYMKY